MRVSFVRHGTTGREERLDGCGDFSLTEIGRQQMLRQTTGDWVSVWSSPLVRAREPAAAVADRLTLPLNVDTGWAELDFGAWEGCLRRDVADEVAAFHADPARHSPPGGERWADFEARVAGALARLLNSNASDGDPARPALVVAHGGSIRMALAIACGLPYERLWCVRIGYGTRITADIARDSDGRPWGEILEIVQP